MLDGKAGCNLNAKEFEKQVDDERRGFGVVTWQDYLPQPPQLRVHPHCYFYVLHYNKVCLSTKQAFFLLTAPNHG